MASRTPQRVRPDTLWIGLLFVYTATPFGRAMLVSSRSDPIRYHPHATLYAPAHEPYVLGVTAEAAPLELSSTDGTPLAGQLYAPAGTAPFTALLLPGIGVPQRALRHLGAYLAGQGARALSIDYRGMGESKAGASSASLRVWAERDAAGALRFAEKEWDAPVVLFGHSFGGQVLGLTDDFSRVRAAVLLASQFGQARHWDGLGRVKVAAFWHVILPLASSVFETVPGWTGIGEAVPRGVAREWARWGRSRDWFVSHVAGAAERLRRFERPIVAYAAPDDPIAPPRAVSALLERFERARVERHDVTPSALGVRSVGHFGLLRPQAETLWREMLAFARREAGAA